MCESADYPLSGAEWEMCSRSLILYQALMCRYYLPLLLWGVIGGRYYKHIFIDGEQEVDIIEHIFVDGETETWEV